MLIVQVDSHPPESGCQGNLTSQNSGNSEAATYLVDVGFGGTGLARPILLRTGQTVPGCAPPEEHRLVRGMHPESSLEVDESSQDWLLQYRCGSHQPDWTVMYLFKESESFPDDWVAYSQWLSAHPPEIFQNNVVCIRYFAIDHDTKVEEAKRPGISLGRLVMMGRRVQKRIGDQSQTVREFSTERERVHVLKEDFGIMVDDDEVQNIAQTGGALKA